MQKVVGSSPIIRFLQKAHRGEKGTDPAIGEPGREQRVSELRVETVVPTELAAEVVAALKEAHPYEEVAFELYPLVDLES